MQNTNKEDRGKDALKSQYDLLYRQLSDLALLPKNFKSKISPGILEQIKAADKRTEDSADVIMTAAENIMALTSELDANKSDKIINEINKIFEASSFQDLVSQHLNEIKLLVEELNEDMAVVEAVLNKGTTGSSKSDTGAFSAHKEKQQKKKRPDDHLLNGPATDV